MEKHPDLTALTGQEKDALIIALYRVIEDLRLQITQQAEEIEKLKGQLGKNSRNSGKPPFSDGLSKPAPKSLGKSGAKKSGGQKGHAGHYLEAARAEGHEERQVFDIPLPRIEVTAHRAEKNAVRAAT